MFYLDDDGYPAEETLTLIERWAFNDKFDHLMDHLAPLFAQFGRCEKREIDGVWEVATGGWSGNEDIIYALKKNVLFWSMCWQLSKRGGYYEFTV